MNQIFSSKRSTWLRIVLLGAGLPACLANNVSDGADESGVAVDGLARAYVVATSPSRLSIGGTFWHPGSNTGLYLKRLKANRVRVFASFLGSEGLRSFVGAKWGQAVDGQPVVSETSFREAINDLRQSPKGAHVNPVQWSRIDAALQDHTQTSTDSLANLIALGKQQNFTVVPQLYASIDSDRKSPNFFDPTTFNKNSPESWAAIWEYYKYMYAMGDWCANHGVKELELQNEPDILVNGDYAAFQAMNLVSAMALRHAVADNQAAVEIIAPPQGQVPLGTYTTFSAQLMRDFASGFAGIDDAKAGNFHIFSYHRYNASGPDAAKIEALNSDHVNQEAGHAIPVFITEMAAHTAGTWENLETTLRRDHGKLGRGGDEICRGPAF